MVFCQYNLFCPVLGAQLTLTQQQTSFVGRKTSFFSKQHLLKIQLKLTCRIRYNR